MILGSLEEFTDLVRMAKARNIFTVVCDGYPNGPAKAEADRSYDIDVRQIDSIAALCHEEEITAIITSFSDLLFECMVKIADKAGLPCYLRPDQLSYYRDKAVMKAVMNELGIPTPRHIRLTKDSSDEVFSEITFPVVAKPLDMYGSRGIYVLDNPQEVKNYYSQVCESSALPEILIEEYNTGYEFNMMTWVKDKRIYMLSIADREKTFTGTKDIPISTRNVYPSRLIDYVWEDAYGILEKFIQKTRQCDGPLSMQFFWSQDHGIQVCEIAGRFFGYEHELLECSSGLSIEKLLLDYVTDDIALITELSRHSPFMKNHSAVLYFQGHDGVVHDQSAAKQIESRKRITKMQLFYREGETISPHGPQPYAARCYIVGKTRKEIDLETKAIFDKMSILDPSGKELLFKNEMTEY